MSYLLLRRRMMMAASKSSLPSEYTQAAYVAPVNRSYAMIAIPNITNNNFGVYLSLHNERNNISMANGCFGYISSTNSDTGMGFMIPTNNSYTNTNICIKFGDVTRKGTDVKNLQIEGDFDIWLGKTDLYSTGAYCKNKSLSTERSLEFTVNNTESPSYVTYNNESVIPLGSTAYKSALGINYMGPNTSNLRIYACKMYNNGVVIVDLIPVMRNSDSVYGFYDLKQKRFYSSVGENAFNGSLT